MKTDHAQKSPLISTFLEPKTSTDGAAFKLATSQCLAFALTLCGGSGESTVTVSGFPLVENEVLTLEHRKTEVFNKEKSSLREAARMLCATKGNTKP